MPGRAPSSSSRPDPDSQEAPGLIGLGAYERREEVPLSLEPDAPDTPPADAGQCRRAAAHPPGLGSAGSAWAGPAHAPDRALRPRWCDGCAGPGPGRTRAGQAGPRAGGQPRRPARQPGQRAGRQGCTRRRHPAAGLGGHPCDQSLDRREQALRPLARLHADRAAGAHAQCAADECRHRAPARHRQRAPVGGLCARAPGSAELWQQRHGQYRPSGCRAVQAAHGHLHHPPALCRFQSRLARPQPRRGGPELPEPGQRSPRHPHGQAAGPGCQHRPAQQHHARAAHPGREPATPGTGRFRRGHLVRPLRPGPAVHRADAEVQQRFCRCPGHA
eukprot:Opistho-2@74065